MDDNLDRDSDAGDGEQDRSPTPPGSPGPLPSAIPLNRRLAAGVVSGIAGGLGMYAVLVVVALSQGRGARYPFAAVQALLSGKRVLPDHPRPALASNQAMDMIFGPMYFFLPAVAVGLIVAMRLRRLGPGDGRREWAVAAAITAAVAGALMYIIFVVGIAGTAVEPHLQRFSSGYGIRELGLLAWLLAHAVYVAVVAATVRALTLRRSRSAPPDVLPESTSSSRSEA